MDHFIKLFKKKKGKDIRKNNRSVQKLRREVEKAKRALSSAHQARIEIESFFEGEDFSETLTRAKFEELNMVCTTNFSLKWNHPLLNNVMGKTKFIAHEKPKIFKDDHNFLWLRTF